MSKETERLAAFILQEDLMPQGFEGSAVDCAIQLLQEFARRGRDSVLPAYMDDGSSIVIDSIAGGKRSTDGVPDELTLCLTDGDGNERREEYKSNTHIRDCYTGLKKDGVISEHGDNPGAAAIAAERARQIEKEGWTPEHDDEHDDEQIAMAAACYAMPGRAMRESHPRQPYGWPWDATAWKPCPDNRVRELTKAGALIAAEIDRLQRAEASATKETP